MELTGLVPFFIDAGTAGVILAVLLWLIVAGHLVPGHIYKEKRDECEDLKAALNNERARGDAAVAAAATTRDLLLAIGGRREAVAPDKES